jgi:hypothetical protein
MEPAPIRVRPAAAAVPYSPGFKKVGVRGWKEY